MQLLVCYFYFLPSFLPSFFLSFFLLFIEVKVDEGWLVVRERDMDMGADWYCGRVGVCASVWGARGSVRTYL